MKAREQKGRQWENAEDSRLVHQQAYFCSFLLLSFSAKYHWQGCYVNAVPYQFLLDSIERLFCTSSFFPPFYLYQSCSRDSLVLAYFYFYFFFSFSLNFLSVSNNWTGPHSALSHGHTYLPACVYLPLPACLPTCGSPPWCVARCIHSPVSHRCTCILNYVARTTVRNGAHAGFDTRTHARACVRLYDGVNNHGATNGGGEWSIRLRR